VALGAAGVVSHPAGTLFPMLCLACTAPTGSMLCTGCVSQLSAAPETLLPTGQLVIGAFTHATAARRLIHALKYRGVSAAAEPFAAELAKRVPPSVTALVPVPRAAGRSIRYGIDPAGELAAAVGRRTGLPVVRGLGAPIWWRRHAGAGRSNRAPIGFRQRLPIPAGAALVDDVVTTGTTAMAASAALRGLPTLVLAATLAPKMRGGETPVEVA